VVSVRDVRRIIGVAGGDDLAAVFSIPEDSGNAIFQWAVNNMPSWSYGNVLSLMHGLTHVAREPSRRSAVLQALTLLMDRRYPLGDKRHSSLLSLYDQGLAQVLEVIRQSPAEGYRYVAAGDPLPTPADPQEVVVLDARGFTAEGENSLALQIKRMHARGSLRFLVTNVAGHRFIGNGLGPETAGVRIDVYGSPGDYLASGIDGLEMFVHNNGQDQLAQIMKAGKLVVFGDVGQTFMYGAKGGEAYVLGNTAGRPVINAVGRPRVVINGTCLDYLAESFMAGEALNGGGFVVLNGVSFDKNGDIIERDTPYHGGNLFSLASGGAIYIRDPHKAVTAGQLNGGEFVSFTDADWNLIQPYLEENSRLFGIAVGDLLQVNGELELPVHVYRKIEARAVRTLQAEEAWVKEEEQ
jgi:glutamate synthase domain-containing protein 3